MLCSQVCFLFCQLAQDVGACMHVSSDVERRTVLPFLM